VQELFQGSKIIREGFARPFGWRGMMVDMEEGGLVLGAVGFLGGGWGRDEAPLSWMEEVILDIKSSTVSRLLLVI
jgi:hypothetical protein